MSRPITRKAPRKDGRFSWARIPMGATGIVVYRLFRRDEVGALHTEGLHFYSHDKRREIAMALRAACHRLRDRVDTLDLAGMGVTQ